MPISLVSCIVPFKNRLAIGSKNDLIVKLKSDLSHFKQLTRDCLSSESSLDKNVIVMGRKTWFSIPRSQRPLSGRINIVLTNDKDLHKVSPYTRQRWWSRKDFKHKNLYFMSYTQFEQFYKETNANVFVIGGGDIYNMFLHNEKEIMRPSKLYITEVYDFKFKTGEEPDVFMDSFDNSYKLTSVSEKVFDESQGVSFRYLEYRRDAKHMSTISDEGKYLDLLRRTLTQGKVRRDRTGVGTIGTLGEQLHFDISQSVPLLTTKRVPWKHCLEELLWFMRGDTHNKVLQKKGVKIWDLNTSREFLDSRGLYHYEEGILGPGYGWQMRFFGANYSQAFADTSDVDTSMIGGVDQLEYIVNELKENPFSRRILMCYWNPPNFQETALLPCHFSVQFYVEEDHDGQKHLSAHFTMRSSDTFLGLPFNILSYALMTYIIAAKCDMKPKKLVYSGCDVHIYRNHVEQVKEQLSRTPRPFPRVIINPAVKDKAWHAISVDDFEVVGYFPYPSIRAPMAV
jgi:thymidylate synthase